MNKELTEPSEKTYAKLQKTLSAMMQDKELAKITVGEICAEADINHSTFYYHYKSIYDLAEQTFMEINRDLIQGFQEKTQGAPFSELSLYQFFDYIRKDRHMYKTTIQSRILFPVENGKEEFEFFFKNYHKNEGISDAAFFYENVFFQAGFTYMLRSWLERDCEDPIESLIEAVRPFVIQEP